MSGVNELSLVQGSVGDQYLTEGEFCSRYRVGPRTAQRWRITGGGPRFVRVGPRRIIYRVSDCESWAQANTFAHRAAELSAA
jgi:hypothetical protein